MPSIEIVVCTNTKELSRQIEIGMSHSYVLAGPVTAGINENGRTIFIATMIKKDNKDEVGG